MQSSAYALVLVAFESIIVHYKCIEASTKLDFVKYPCSVCVLQSCSIQPLRCLSGGQRARVILTRLVNTMPDLLLLDEPSNHLDGDAVNGLKRELSAYNGAVFFASHDQVSHTYTDMTAYTAHTWALIVTATRCSCVSDVPHLSCHCFASAKVRNVYMDCSCSGVCIKCSNRVMGVAEETS
jgi:ABC-type Mn2+/Zn2+ transport system ATPase subunit